MSFPRKEATAFLVPQSWLTSLFVRHWCNFCSFVCSTSQKTFHFQLSSAFFRWWCWRKVLPSYLWRKTFRLQFTLTQWRKATNCRECFHSILRWKDKSTKLEGKFWIKDCAQNEKSIFLQARLSKYQPRLQVFNLKSKWRKLQEKLLRLNIAPKTKNQYSCRRGW